MLGFFQGLGRIYGLMRMIVIVTAATRLMLVVEQTIRSKSANPFFFEDAQEILSRRAAVIGTRP
jgi:hypothetical protein